ncbi:MAG TPA: XdhC family protein [Baekduia sp.]|nr:XdhC family protein [Baekduia sp.]
MRQRLEGIVNHRVNSSTDVAACRFVDVCASPPRLIVVGAVPVAQALCRAARDAGWRPSVVDPRNRFATPERVPDAERIVVAWPEDGIAQLGGVDPATAVVALSHDPKIDDPALALAVRAGAGFVGAMGSRRATADRRLRHDRGAPARTSAHRRGLRPRPRRVAAGERVRGARVPRRPSVLSVSSAGLRGRDLVCAGAGC